MKIIIINGNYRSGTTWIQKILDNNDQINLCSQPFFELFKLFEQFIRKKQKIKIDKNLPNGLLTYKKLPKSLLKEKFLEKKSLIKLIDQITKSNNEERYVHTSRKFYKVFKKKLIKLNDRLSFDEIFQQLILSINSYKKNSNIIEYTGFKEGYLTSILPLLAKIENCKIINIIRDPREIAFSRNYSKNKKLKDFDVRSKHPYILISLLSKTNMEMSLKLKNKKNFLSVNFNKLIMNKERELKRLSSFLKIKLSVKKKLINNENNKVWKANTGGVNKIGNYGSNWKNQMKYEEIAIIEKICHKMMKKNNYKFFFENEKKIKFYSTIFNESPKYIKPWLRKKYFLKYDKDFVQKLKIT